VSQKAKEQTFRILEWDSDFFGIKIARILAARHSHLSLKKVISNLASAKVQLAYWDSDPACLASQQAALACRGLLVDQKVTYSKQEKNRSFKAPDRPWRVESYSAHIATKDLEMLAIEAGGKSRFRADCSIPKRQWMRLFREWINNSVNGKIADTVLVARDSDQIVGMVTLADKAGIAEIGLIASHPAMRGKGIGQALIDVAADWALARNLSETRVVTQKLNATACHFYERSGFVATKKVHVYHFWLK